MLHYSCEHANNVHNYECSSFFTSPSKPLHQLVLKHVVNISYKPSQEYSLGHLFPAASCFLVLHERCLAEVFLWKDQFWKVHWTNERKSNCYNVFLLSKGFRDGIWRRGFFTNVWEIEIGYSDMWNTSIVVNFYSFWFNPSRNWF